MIIDANDYPINHILEYDICIVGSGPASLSFISQFLINNGSYKNIRIAVLESGNTTDAIYQNYNALGGLTRLYRSVQSDVQHLYNGTVRGWLEKKKPNYLTESRLRGYGGTGNIWSGWFWTLEPHDLEKGNWPIEYKDLEEYYQKSCALYNLPAICSLEVNHPSLKLPDIYPISNFKGKNLKPRHLLFKRINFGQIYKNLFSENTQIDLIINANVTDINLINNEAFVSNLNICVPISEKAHNYLTVTANQFVLAAGCIETTRLLQLSSIKNPNIGVYFQEHYYLWNAGTYKTNKISQKIKDCYFSSECWQKIKDTQIFTSLVPTKEFLDDKNCNNFRVLLGGAPDIPNTINLCWEQEARMDSKIILEKDQKRDCFGNPRIIVETQFYEEDKLTLQIAIETTRCYLENQKVGYNFELPDLTKNPLEWPDTHRITPGNHPSGTTRMSVDLTKGVVDANCKIHGVNNLYVCSSSVFPTGGYANPTLTIIALAIRLSEHMKKLW